MNVCFLDDKLKKKDKMANDPLFGGLPYQNLGPHVLNIDTQVKFIIFSKIVLEIRNIYFNLI